MWWLAPARRKKMNDLVNVSVNVNGQDVEVVHVRHDGRSHDVYVSDLGLNDNVTQQQLFTAVEDNLDLTQGSLNGYELDVVAASRTGVIRPVAKFGI